MTLLEPGTHLGPYEIVAHLGAGGMGQVYKARHARLDRTVALKVLPEELASDPERLERFEREARAASALDHPGIVTIHDIAEARGLRFIAMQYVRGQTLTGLLAKGRLDLKNVLSYGIQIADALSAAHTHGIVHRDLKPDNLMVGQDGRVRILDFGLAKKMEPREATRLRTAAPSELTRDGRIMGTAPYMSPEQALGERTDHRSDIFSFGSVLYEMVTGRRPFDADNVPGLLVSIVHDEPTRPSALVPGLPLQLEQVLERALRKDPNKRFQSMADVRVELEEVRAAVDSGSFISAEQLPAQRRSHWKGWVGAALAIVVVVTATQDWLPRFAPESSLLPSFPEPITSLTGDERHPALSSDGRQVAFVWDGGQGSPPRQGLMVRSSEGDPSHIYVTLSSGGTPLQLTDTESADTRPTWSPDGSEIAFLRRSPDATDFDVMAIPALGGAARRITSAGRGLGLDWSPDGEWLVLVESTLTGGKRGLHLHSLESGERRQLTFPGESLLDENPTFSPDGSLLAFSRFIVNAGGTHLFVQSLTGGEPRQLSESELNRPSGLSWAPDGESLIVAVPQEGRMWDSHLARLPLAGGEMLRLAFGDGAQHVSVARKANILVYGQAREPNVDIWRASGPAADTASVTTPWVTSTRLDWQPAYSPDDRNIAFGSERSGALEIWIADAEGSNAWQLTELAGVNYPRWSPDGSRILFNSWTGTCGLCLIDAAGGVPQDVGPGGDFLVALPGWSTDGAWMYFQSREGSPNWRLWKMLVGGGERTRLADGFGLVPRGGVDGLVYFERGGVWRVSHDGGEPEQMLDWGPDAWGEWDLWRDQLVYIDREDPLGAAVWTMDLTSRAKRRVAPIEGDFTPFTQISVSPDGRWVLYAHADPGTGADLMRVANFR